MFCLKLKLAVGSYLSVDRYKYVEVGSKHDDDDDKKWNVPSARQQITEIRGHYLLLMH